MSTFVQGDYLYTIVDYNNFIERIEVVDKTQSTYQDVPSKVTYNGVTYTVRRVDGLFQNCRLLTTPPVIPSSVTNMSYCFDGCIKLTTPPVIPNSVVNMSYCFRNCKKLEETPTIPTGVREIRSCFYNCVKLKELPVIYNKVVMMQECFSGCINIEGDIYIYAQTAFYNNMFYDTQKPITIIPKYVDVNICQRYAQTANNKNVYVNIHTEEQITFKDTEMNYKQDDEMKKMSLQTNANLVQCEVPDLVNGGKKTTNVNDALIDLYKRGAL